MRWLDSINSMDMNMSKLWEIMEDRGAFCNPWGHKESDMTVLNNNKWVKKKKYIYIYIYR